MHIFRNFPILRILSASLLVPVTFGTVRVCLKMWYWVHVVSCLVSPEVVSGRCAVGKCV